MKDYYETLMWKARFKDIERQEKKSMHRKFMKTHGKTVRFCDWLIVFAIVINLGAAFLSSLMIAHANPTTEILEANPIQAKLKGYKPTPNNDIYIQLLIATVLRTLLVFGYVWFRRNIYSEEGLVMLITITSIIAFTMSWDFFNDLGLYIGKIVGG